MVVSVVEWTGCNTAVIMLGPQATVMMVRLQWLLYCRITSHFYIIWNTNNRNNVRMSNHRYNCNITSNRYNGTIRNNLWNIKITTHTLRALVIVTSYHSGYFQNVIGFSVKSIGYVEEYYEYYSVIKKMRGTVLIFLQKIPKNFYRLTPMF